MHTICRLLCFCCYKPNHPSSPEVRARLLDPESPKSFRQASPPLTPDSAYVDGTTHQGTTTQASPGKSTYGGVPVDKYV